MLPPHRSSPRTWLPACAATLMLLLAGPPGTAWGLTGATKTATTPTLPVPASAKVQPETAGGTTPTTTTVPTTTYTPQSTTTQPGAAALGTTTTTPATSSTSRGAKTPTKSSSSKLSTPALAVAVLAALLALACVAWAAARLTAYEPRWARSARHSLAEGGFRASATWAEFTDWLRLGR